MDKLEFAMKLLEDSIGGTMKLPPVSYVYDRDLYKEMNGLKKDEDVTNDTSEIWVKFQTGTIIDYPITKFFPDFEELFTQLNSSPDIGNTPCDE